MCCCRPKAKKASRDKRDSSNDEEQIVVGSDEANQREELEVQNSLSERSTVEFHEVSATDR